MNDAHRRDARLMVFASLLFAFAAAVPAANLGTHASKYALVSQNKTFASATNGILTVTYDTSDGRFSIDTGANHPLPGQSVFFPTGTSYITLRDSDSQEIFIN